MSAGTLWCAGYGNYSSLLSTFCMESMQIYKEIHNKQFDIEFVQNGALKIANSEQQKADIYKAYLLQKRNGYDVEFIDSTQQIQAIERNLSPNVIACVHTPQSGHIHPGKATVAIADAAIANGAKIVENTNVLRIRRLDCEYVVETECGKAIRAKHVIIASGVQCGSANLYGLAIQIPVVPVKGQIWTTNAQPINCLKKVIFISESHSFWQRTSSKDDQNSIPEYCTHNCDGKRLTNHSYGRQCADNTLLFGGSRIAMSDGNKCLLDRDEIAQSVAFVESNVLSMNGLSKQLNGSWCGAMPFSMDGRPIVGELDAIGLPNIWLLVGFGPHGMMEGPGAAKYIARRIENDQHETDECAKEIHPLRENCVKTL